MLCLSTLSAALVLLPNAARLTAPQTRWATPLMVNEVHGEGGAYVAGHWVPLSECPDQFNIGDGSDSKVPSMPCAAPIS